MRTLFIVSALLVSVMPIAAPAQSIANVVRVDGTVVSATATSIVVATASGSKTVALAPKMRFFGLTNSSLDKVTQGSFIGTTVAPQPDGTFKSVEVHVFAPSLRGTGEGFTKMGGPGKHMMANSTVKTVSHSANMMANSTVRTVGSSNGGKTISMVFPSGTKSITIPANTKVTYIEPGTKAMLVPGAHVLLLTTSTKAGLVANTIVVGEHGATPM